MTIDVYHMLDDNGSTMAFYAKGNYDLQQMIDGIKYDEGDDYFEYEKIDENKLKVIHCHLRCVPASIYDRENWSYQLLVSKKGRGAFEASVVYLDNLDIP